MGYSAKPYISTEATTVTSNSSVTMTSDCLIDMNQFCRDCGILFHSCVEKKLCNICLHSILDYFEAFGYDAITRSGANKKNYMAFIVKIKFEILKGLTVLMRISSSETQWPRRENCRQKL